MGDGEIKVCSVVKNLEVVRGDIGDYRVLSRYHYRGERLGPFVEIYAIRPGIGVIVYTMPSLGVEARNIALGGVLDGFDKSSRAAMVNKNIRCVGRVIIEPRYRGLGLASRLVRETMGKVGVAVIEAMAVMGKVNRFFERAGMTGYEAKESVGCAQLVEAFSLVGIEEDELVLPATVQGKIERLGRVERRFIDGQVSGFLQNYGKRRYMDAGIERTGFVLGKLGFRPTYYVWIRPQTDLCSVRECKINGAKKMKL